MWLSMNLKRLHHTLIWQCHRGKGLCDKDCTNNRMLFNVGASLGHWVFPVKAQLTQCGVVMSHKVFAASDEIQLWASSFKERETCFSRQWRMTRLQGQVLITSPLFSANRKYFQKFPNILARFFQFFKQTFFQ